MQEKCLKERWSLDRDSFTHKLYEEQGFSDSVPERGEVHNQGFSYMHVRRARFQKKKWLYKKKKRVGWGGGFDGQGFHLHHPNMKGKVSEKVTLKKGGGGIPCHQFICSYMQM